MKRRILKTLKGTLAVVLAFSMCVPVSAAESKQDAQQNIQNLENEKNALQSKLSSLKANKTDTEAYLGELDNELQSVLGEVDKANADLSATEAELEVTQQNLADAKDKEAAQYEALKIRIKYMYEEGDTGYVEILLKAENLASFLNSTEYISKISDYDNNLLQNLMETRQQIADYEAQLLDQKAQIEALKAELEAKQEELEAIVAAKQEELQSISADIVWAQDQVYDINASIQAEAKIIAEIEAAEKAAAEEAARQQEIQQQQQQQNNNNSVNNNTDNNSNNTTPPNGGSSGGSSGGNSGGSSSNIPVYSGLSWPIGYYNISSYFGGRGTVTDANGNVVSTGAHYGIDIPAPAGTPIYASAAGTVEAATYGSSTGNYVLINHGGGIKTVYMHASALYVSAGQSVSAGQVIAGVGSTGDSTGNHLHFGVKVNGSYQNPLYYVSP